MRELKASRADYAEALSSFWSDIGRLASMGARVVELEQGIGIVGREIAHQGREIKVLSRQLHADDEWSMDVDLRIAAIRTHVNALRSLLGLEAGGSRLDQMQALIVTIEREIAELNPGGGCAARQP